MASRKRNKAQIEHDRRDIANMYLMGWTQARIAAEIRSTRDYELTQQMISYDLQRVQEQWREEAVRAFDERVAEELARVDRLEREYWEAWLRSCEDQEQIRKEGAPSDAPRKIVHSQKTQVGNPAFLRGVQWCIEQRCEILGLYQPEKLHLSGGLDLADTIIYGEGVEPP